MGEKGREGRPLAFYFPFEKEHVQKMRDVAEEKHLWKNAHQESTATVKHGRGGPGNCKYVSVWLGKNRGEKQA